METVLEYPSTATTTLASERTKTQPPTASRVAVSTLFLLNGALYGTWVSRLPAMEAQRGLSHAALGLALLGMALGALVSMPIAGRLSARFSSAQVCKVHVLFYILALPFLAVVPGFPALVFLLFLFGASHGAVDVAMNAQAVAVEKRYPRPIMSSIHALFSLGGLIGAASGGFAAAQGITPVWHFAGVSVVLLVAAVFTFSHLLDDRDEPKPVETTSLENRKPQRWSLPPRNLVFLGIISFCAMMGEGAMADWSAIYLRGTLKSTEAIAAAGYAAFSIAMAVTRFFGDALILRIGTVALARISGACAVGGLSLALITDSPLVAMVGFAGVGLGFAIVVPMAFSAAGRTPGVNAGRALGTASTIGYFGFLLGPPIIGFAAQAMGLRSALVIVLVSSALIWVFARAVK